MVRKAAAEEVDLVDLMVGAAWAPAVAADLNAAERPISAVSQPSSAHRTWHRSIETELAVETVLLPKIADSSFAVVVFVHSAQRSCPVRKIVKKERDSRFSLD